MDEAILRDERIGHATTPFVGRDGELEMLLSGLADAGAGRRRIVLLGGDPGIGKTRLATEFARRAGEAGARLLWGRSWEEGGAPAFWPWIQALRALVEGADVALVEARAGASAAELAQMLPEIRAVVPGVPELAPSLSEEARFRLFDAVHTFLVRASD